MRGIRELTASAILSLAASVHATPPVASTCYGSAEKGKLEKGVALPASGPNFVAYNALGVKLGRNCVHTEVEAIVVAAYADLAREKPATRFVYGETGFCTGGDFAPHKTHQNGTSVDFMVPVLDATGASVVLPTGENVKYGYAHEFDASGSNGALRIDFVAVAAHLLALEREASARGVKIRRVIFAPEFEKRVLATPLGPEVAVRLTFSKGKPWVRHDEHYHVDFLPGCEPLESKANK